MRLEELFKDAASLGEPPIPGDVLGRLAAVQARRRQQLSWVAVLVVFLGTAGAAGVLSAPHTTRPLSPPVGRAELTQLPAAFYARVRGHLELISLDSGSRRDLGLGRLITATTTGLALTTVDTTSTCVQTFRWRQFGTASGSLPPPIPATGAVSDVQFSPDGRFVAYAIVPRDRLGLDPGFGGCRGDSDLVVRNVTTGAERRWSTSTRASEGGIIRSLSWRANGRILAFQIEPVTGSPTAMKLLDVNSPNNSLSDVNSLPPGQPVGLAPQLCQESLPGWLEGTLVDVQMCRPKGEPVTVRVLDTGTGKVLFNLPAMPLRLSATGSRYLLLTFAAHRPQESEAVLYDVKEADRRTVLLRGAQSANW